MKPHSSMFKSVIGVASLSLILVVILAPSGHASSDVLWSQQEVSAPSINAVFRFSPDGELVATGRRETNDVYIRSASDGTLVRVLNGKNNDANALAFSPDSQLLVTGTGGPGVGLSLNLWGVADGVRLVGRIPAHSNGTTGVAISPDGQLVATCGFHDRTIMLWHLPDMTRAGAVTNSDPDLGGTALFVRAIAFSPDGQLLATGDSNNIKLRRVSDFSIVRTMAQSAAHDYVTLAFSPDGQELVAGLTDLDVTYGRCADCSVKLWKVSDGTLLRTFYSGAGELRYTKVDFSADGQTVGAGFTIEPDEVTGVIQFWDTRNGSSFFIDYQPSPVHAFTISPSGKFYGYMLADGTVAVAPMPVSSQSADDYGSRNR